MDTFLREGRSNKIFSKVKEFTMSELERASIRVFAIIMIGLGVILWLQLQGCAPPLPAPHEYEYVPMDSTLA